MSIVTNEYCIGFQLLKGGWGEGVGNSMELWWSNTHTHTHKHILQVELAPFALFEAVCGVGMHMHV